MLHPMPNPTAFCARLLARLAPLGALFVLGAACATTGSTFRSGVGDKLLEHPPYYAGAASASGDGAIGHWPIIYQRGSSQSPIFDPEGGAGTPIAALLAEMNAFLDSLGVTARLATARATADGTPPDVQFGCETQGTDECVTPTTPGVLASDKIRMRLAVGRPSTSWVESTRAAMSRAGVSRTLVLTLEVGQYSVKQRGRFGGRKEVDLGTGYSVGVPWLTALDKPVNVLQLTGALVDADGQAVRIGAEGLFARRTNIVLSGLGAQELITDDDVQHIRALRREDLPGRPLVWQVALRNLVAELTGRREVAAR
jgi:hypothetical protein